MNVPDLWDGLDSINIGLFTIDSDGVLTRYNRSAAGILGIDGDTDWSQLHVSRLDRTLATGLAEKLNDLLAGKTSFSRRGIKCTNSRGGYLDLDLVCLPVQAENGGREHALGVIRNSVDGDTIAPAGSQSLQELEILCKVASALSSSQGLSQILRIILTGATASQGLGFNRAFLMLYDESTETLRGHLAVGPASAEEAGDIWHTLDDMRLSLDDLLHAEADLVPRDLDPISDLICDLEIGLKDSSLIADACRKSVWVNLEQVDDIDAITASFLDHLGTHRMALAPMVSKGHLMGLLAADNLITSRPISDNDVRLLQIFANQAAVAMERASLYEEQKTRAIQLERMNRRLAESQDQIVKIEKMSVIGELTASIAHELRNPLTIIGGFANLMLNAGVTDEQREYLNIIASETRRSEAVLDEVLDFSHASKSDTQPIDFLRLVERSLDLLLSRLRRSDEGFLLSADHQKMTVLGNYDQLSHALYQLFMVIADDIMPPAIVRVRTEKTRGKAIVRLSVKTDETDRERVTKAMRQIFAENRTTRRLTVMVAAETIRFHGGDLGLASEDSNPPSLYVELPLMEENDHERANNRN